MDLTKLIRENILELQPYSCARDEFQGEASIFLDANESPFETGLNRYPDPLQKALKTKIGALKQIATENIFLGNGSDEAIDLIYRVFCEPKTDNVVAIEPTYGMYKVCADINNVEYRKSSLNADFDINADDVLQKTDAHTKVIWLCSPNNPTGNSLNADDIKKILENFGGIVVVDEAYIDFSSQPSWAKKLADYQNLIVLQTLSKAWGSAAIRLGMAFASETIIQTLNKVKYPYNINILTQRQALLQLEKRDEIMQQIDCILQQREMLSRELRLLKIVKKVHPSDANFLLVEVENANATYGYLTKRGIIVRNRNNVALCGNCLRITVGLPHENEQLLAQLKRFEEE